MEIGVFQDGQENEVVHVLEVTHQKPMLQQWLWKYRLNPRFDPSIVPIAKTSGKIVGCLHRFPIRLRLSETLIVNAVLEGDLGVAPEYRLRGLARALMFSPRFGEAILTYGFCGADIYRNFHSKLGLIPVPDSTIVYTKILSTKGIMTRLSGLLSLSKGGDIRDKLYGLRLVVRIEARGAPPFALRVEEGQIHVEGEANRPSDVRVWGDLLFLTTLHKTSLKSLIYALLSGRLRVKGSPTGLFRLITLLRIVRRALKANSRRLQP